MRRLLFHHIPKTAGISIREFWWHAYGRKRCLGLRRQDDTLGSTSQEQIDSARFIWLHEPLWLLEEFDIRDYFSFTVVREPESRIASLFCYLRDPNKFARQDFTKTPAQVVTSLRSIQDMTFEQFVTSDDPYVARNLGEIYVRFLLGRDSVKRLASNDGIRDSKLLSEIFHRMRACYAYVGLTSTLEADMNLLGRYCLPGIEPRFSSDRLNQSKKDADLSLSEEARAILRERLALDYLIYDYACLLREHCYHKLQEELAKGAPTN